MAWVGILTHSSFCCETKQEEFETLRKEKLTAWDFLLSRELHQGGRMAFLLERLLPKVLSRLFRRLFLEALATAFDAGALSFFGSLSHLAEPDTFHQHLAAFKNVEWVVYAKPPFGGPEQVLAYLGRYTHRVAIANSRLIDDVDGVIRFRWKDYRHHDKNKVMALSDDEFIRRFLLHALPDGFHRIRHYGFLANGHRSERLTLCRQWLSAPIPPPPPDPPLDYRERYARLTGRSLDICACCGGRMQPSEPIRRFPSRLMSLREDSS